MTNLFDFATKELSQDAFLLWLFSNVNCEDTEVSNAAKGLLKEFGITDEIESVKVIAQKNNIDVSAYFETDNGTIGLFIEDKTFSSIHDDQLNTYSESIKKYNITKAYKIYYKSSLISDWESENIAKYGWTQFDINDILKYWQNFKNSNNIIIKDYANHIIDVERKINNTILPNNDDIDLWEGFFRNTIIPKLKEKINCWTFIFRGQYAGIIVRPREFKDNTPYLEIRSRDLLSGNFDARILVYYMETNGHDNAKQVIKDEINSRKFTGIFKTNNYKEQLGITPKNKYKFDSEESLYNLIELVSEEFNIIMNQLLTKYSWFKDLGKDE